MLKPEKVLEGTILQIEEEKKGYPLEEAREDAFSMPEIARPKLAELLREPGMSYIGEIRTSTPYAESFGEEAPVERLAPEYRGLGVTAISVVTMKRYCDGSPELLKKTAETVPDIPILRRDVILEPYQVYTTRALGASVINFTSCITDAGKMKELVAISKELGLEVMIDVTVPREAEEALLLCPDIMGVNNWYDQSFNMDYEIPRVIRDIVPVEIPMVVEKGAKTPADILAFHRAGVDGVILGDRFIFAQDRKSVLEYMNKAFIEGIFDPEEKEQDIDTEKTRIEPQ